jgi:hypothetical protein
MFAFFFKFISVCIQLLSVVLYVVVSLLLKYFSLESLIIADSDFPRDLVTYSLVSNTKTGLLSLLSAPSTLGIALYSTIFFRFGLASIKNLSKSDDGDKVSYIVQNSMTRLSQLANYSGSKVPDNYNKYPSKDSIELLQHFLRCNPYFTGFLIPDQETNGFKIDSYDNSSKNNRFVEIIACMDPSSLERINATFDSDMTLTRICYVTKDGEEGTALTGPDMYTAGSKLVWNLVFAAEAIHLAFHIYHYLMNVGLVHACLDNSTLLAWAKTYTYSVDIGLFAVDLTLLNERWGSLVVSPIKSNRTQLLGVIRKMMAEWGGLKSSDDFVKNWLFPMTHDRLTSNGHVSAFLDQAGLAAKYATDLSKAVKKVTKNIEEFNIIELKLKTFLTNVGSGAQPLSQVSDLNTWIQLMSVTSIFHGLTPSFTRLAFSNEYYQYTNKNPTYGQSDVNFIYIAFLTMAIVAPNKYAYSDKNFPRSLKKVIQSYDQQTKDLKTDYMKQIKRDSDLFNKHGWIYADYFPDNFDCRSLGIAYY